MKMEEKVLREKIEEYIKYLSVEDLEEKIAPVDCTKKPNHPDCQVKALYGVEPPVDRYGGPF